jgi:hypothetical protein
MNTGKDLLDEAKALMEAGDATSEAAMDFARRYRELMSQMKSSQSPVLSLTSKVNLALGAVQMAPKLVKRVKLFAYIPKVLKNLKALENKAANQKT